MHALVKFCSGAGKSLKSVLGVQLWREAFQLRQRHLKRNNVHGFCMECIDLRGRRRKQQIQPLSPSSHPCFEALQAFP